MMATTAMQLAIDAFVHCDNAGGIAEMSELPRKCGKNGHTGCGREYDAATGKVLRSLRRH